MLAKAGEVHIRRHGTERVVALDQVLPGDEFQDGTAWWKLTLVPRCFISLEQGETFKFKRAWYHVGRKAGKTIAIPLEPNVPFGDETDRESPPTILAATIVEYLSVDLLSRVEKVESQL